MKVTLFGNIQNGHWQSPSMNRFTREIYDALKNKKLEVELVEPKVPFYLDFLPAKAKFSYSRFSYYPSLAKNVKSDVYHITDHSYGQVAKELDPTKTVITCHDLIPLSYEKDKFALEKFKESISYLEKVKVVTADSEVTKKDLIEKLGLKEQSIIVVPAGRDERYQPVFEKEVNDFKNKYKLPNKPLLLHVGNNLPYKNIENLLAALKILKEEGVSLVLVKVGSTFTEHQTELIKEFGLEDNIQKLDFVPEEEMPALYNSATALVYPSLVEGFGFPTLEALSCVLPVVISKGTSLEEIAGEAGIYVDPMSATDIANGIRKVLSLSKEEKEKLTKVGLQRSQEFSWEKTADKLINIYEALSI